jgi:hypothetical protein
VGGWIAGGILRYASGALIGVPSSRTNINNYTFNTNTRFDPVPGQPFFLKNLDKLLIVGKIVVLISHSMLTAILPQNPNAPDTPALSP